MAGPAAFAADANNGHVLYDAFCRGWGGTWTTTNTFIGKWYRSSGPPYSTPFKPNDIFEIGSATLVFQSATQATLTFSVDGTVTTKIMQRLQF